MFDLLQFAKPDTILSLAAAYREDARPTKLDLGVGVFRDGSGHTPILLAVREAEQRLYRSENTKTYLTPAGDPGFCGSVIRLVFGGVDEGISVNAVQTPGGAGALRILMGLSSQARPGGRIWLPDPTWINHHAIAADAGLAIGVYPYLDTATYTVRFDAICDALQKASPGDIVLLHGCCHNPSGADLSLPQWRAIAQIVLERGLFPLVDLAYQGFGNGIEEDAAATCLLAQIVPEMGVAYSCSKNFGIYRERTGAAILVARASTNLAAAYSQLLVRARVGYSMPPDHGASIVRIILSDPILTASWRTELDSMRAFIQTIRRALVDEFRRQSSSDNFAYIGENKGMFSLLGSTAEQVSALRRDYGIFVVPDGRMNLAGMPIAAVPNFVEAVLDVGIRSGC